MKHLGLFEGIGGFSYAAKLMGWQTVAWCEWNPFGQQVLRYHFPEAEGFSDITKSDFIKYHGTIDILTGGFPCQPYSQAGKRLGKEDERHLWPEMLRAIREISPRYVVGENVRGLTNWNGGLVFDEVQADLESAGYEVLPFLLPACAVNAPHRRDRIWFVATNDRGVNENQINPNTYSSPSQRRDSKAQERREDKGGRAKPLGVDTSWQIFPTQSPICGGNDGLPTELDGITFSKWRNESIKAYGNAIVPQVAVQIFKAIEAYNKTILNP